MTTIFLVVVRLFKHQAGRQPLVYGVAIACHHAFNRFLLTISLSRLLLLVGGKLPVLFFN